MPEPTTAENTGQNVSGPPQETPPATDPPAPSDQSQEPPQEPQDAASKARREAANYRTQLRDVEQQRDGLTTQLDAARRALVDQHLRTAHGWKTGAAFHAAGIDVAALFDNDGHLDTDALATHAADVAKKFGIATTTAAQRTADAFASAEGSTTATPSGAPKPATWADVFRQ